MRDIEIIEERQQIEYMDGNIRKLINYKDYDGEVTQDNVEEVIEELQK